MKKIIASAIVLLSFFASSVQADIAHAGTGPPNIVLIVTDDQRWDTLRYMPVVQAKLVNKGTTFENAFVVNPVSTASRVTILTGTYSHTNRVYADIGPYGGWQSFRRDGSTIATWLNRDGYETSLIGKYLNQHTAPYIPNGWDNWVTFERDDGEGQYYDYKLTVNGTTERHLSERPKDYSTDVLAQHSGDFIRATPRTHLSSSTSPRRLPVSQPLPHRGMNVSTGESPRGDRPATTSGPSPTSRNTCVRLSASHRRVRPRSTACAAGSSPHLRPSMTRLERSWKL